jgi:tetratricopeptide (TPR) repeat protein
MVTEIQLEPVLTAIKNQDKARARDLLTQFLKNEPKNARLWMLMTSAVETRKEMIICLQKAHEADPENQAAIAGLVHFGMLKPEEAGSWADSIPTRDWETPLREKFKNEQKKQVVKTKRPWKKTAAWAASAIGVLAIIVYAVFFSPLLRRGRQTTTSYIPLGTVKPTATYLPTKTPEGFIPSPTKVGTLSLASLLSATYTPTPDYVYTPHPSEAFQLAIRAMQKSDWQGVITYMQQYTGTEKNAADAYYFMGEAHRAIGDTEAARADYYAAITADKNYAPGWLGVARLQYDGKNYRDAVDSLNKAIDLDPNLGPAYLLLASTYYETNDLTRCRENLDEATQLMPNHTRVYLLEAKLDLQNGDSAQALVASQKSNEIDATILEDYFLMGKAYLALENNLKAVQALDTYTHYAPDDAEAFMLLGKASQAMGQDDQAIEAYTRATAIDETLFDAYLQTALLYLKHGKTDLAAGMLEKANLLNPKDYETAINRAELMFAEEDTGNAYMVLIGAEGSVETDEQKARFLYDRARMLVALKQVPVAVKDWKALLALPEGVVSEDRLTEARDFLLTCNVSGCARVTLTVTPGGETTVPTLTTGTVSPTGVIRTGTQTVTPTVGKGTATRTPTQTPARSSSPAATQTPTK